MNIFEIATREAFRFKGSNGLLSVEDLWDLPLQSQTKTNLDGLAQALDLQIKEAQANTKSFVTPEKSSVDETLVIKLEVLKHIIGVKVAERDAAATARRKSEEKQKLLALLDRKENEALDNLTAEEIKARIAAM